MSATIYQSHVENLLKQIFPDENVKREWSIWNGEEDGFRRTNTTYAPRLDIAVGPFNITTENRYEDTEVIRSWNAQNLINEIITKGQQENVDWRYNNNPRCLLAIEIEYNGSSKHILGDYTNASMMGHIGIVVSSTKNYKKISRVGEYVKTLRQLEKAPADLFCNTVLYREDEFEELLRRHIPQN
jgi:hypothetical protein